MRNRTFAQETGLANGEEDRNSLLDEIVNKKHDKRVGDIVRPISQKYTLRSGASWYEVAVVVCQDPFVLVSEEADMRWGSMTAEGFAVVGKASEAMLAKCKERL